MIILPISDVRFETKLLMAALDISEIMYIYLHIYFKHLMNREVDTKADALQM